MTETLLFPGLGLSFQLNRVAFSIAGRPIYWYGIIFGLSFIVGALYIIKRVREFGLDADRVIDVLLGTVLGGLLGARIYYVAFSWELYQGDLLKILNVREGGIGMYGGVIGAALAATAMCRLRKVRFIPVCDLFFGGLIVAQSIGRWGNFVNIEAFGYPTDAPWGMTSDSIINYLNWIGISAAPGTLVHPTFFYESAWCLAGFIIMALYVKKRRYDGELSLIYLGWYGLGRFFIEGLRTDSLMLGDFRISQILAGVCVVISAAMLWRIRAKIKAADDPDFMMLYVNTEEGKAVLDGSFYAVKEAQPEAEGEQPEAEGEQPEPEGEQPEPEGEQPEAEEEPKEQTTEASAE